MNGDHYQQSTEIDFVDRDQTLAVSGQDGAGLKQQQNQPHQCAYLIVRNLSNDLILWISGLRIGRLTNHSIIFRPIGGWIENSETIFKLEFARLR